MHSQSLALLYLLGAAVSLVSASDWSSSSDDSWGTTSTPTVTDTVVLTTTQISEIESIVTDLESVSIWVTDVTTEIDVTTKVDVETEIDTKTQTDVWTTVETDLVTDIVTDIVTDLVTKTVSVTEVSVQVTTSVSVSKTVEVVTTTAVTTFTPSPSPYCDFCKVAVQGTELKYPYHVVTSTVYATTINVYTTILPDGQKVTNSVTNPATPGCSPPSTWITYGVVLTSPTTYIAYTSFEHEWIVPEPTLAGCGELVTANLTLPTTDWAALIWPTNTVVTTATPIPSGLVSYLDSFPTVIQQLNGTPAVSCDDPEVTATAATSASETVTTTTTIAGNTVEQHVASSGSASSSSSSTDTSTATTSNLVKRQFTQSASATASAPTAKANSATRSTSFLSTTGAGVKVMGGAIMLYTALIVVL